MFFRLRLMVCCVAFMAFRLATEAEVIICMSWLCRVLYICVCYLLKLLSQNIVYGVNPE